MTKNFLEKLKEKKEKGETLVVLAPMADVTDSVFREMIKKYSRSKNNDKPNIFWTEFVSADGLSNKIGRKKLLIDLKFNKKNERPILAQIFGSKKENIETAIKIIYKLGFDGIDLNFGCPDKTIEKQFAGAAMIKNQDMAEEILNITKKTVSKLNTKTKFFSFSVKTRIGYNKIEYKTWLSKILKYEPDILTIHLRTRKEMSLVPAHFEISKDIVDFIKNFCKENNLNIPFIILNGDIKDLIEAEIRIKESKCDAVMIGRGVFGTPWLFNKKEYLKRKEINSNTKKGKENILFRLNICLEHTKLFEKKLGKYKSFNIMKKHYKAYINGFDDAKELRIKMMNAKNYNEIKNIIKNYIKNNLYQKNIKNKL